ncbi:DUF4312 family protein [Amphibacillus sp. Q70]|uniref:DUF4312 family protein n=1 Tax=Amphibacillus sp. Q70 TaxID=3453416 RepID=UPI003F8680D6
MTSILQSKMEWVEVTGNGETTHQAIEQAFKEMRKKIASQFKQPIVSMRTEDVVLIDTTKEERKEAFLFFFMKRKRVSWNIRVKIKLKIDYVLIEGGE